MELDLSSEQPSIGAVDLFCGAGGLSLGLSRSGIEICAGLDIDPTCRFPFEQNISSRFVRGDIRDVDGHELLSLFGRERYKLIAACAPCQPFSGYSLGKGSRSKDWGLLLEVQRLISQVVPDFVTVENVPRLSRAPIWQQFIDGLENLGYHCRWSVLDASSYGVPQTRRRLVLLASRHGQIELPPPTHSSPMSVRDAISQLPSLRAGQEYLHDPLHVARSLSDRNLKRIRLSRPGESWRTWPKKLRANCHKKQSGSTFPSVYGRMAWDAPSPTITTQFYGFGNGRFGHPDQDRAISLREGAILQSFPSDFVFSEQVKGRVKQIGKLVGNAVPPKLAESIGAAIVRHAGLL